MSEHEMLLLFQRLHEMGRDKDLFIALYNAHARHVFAVELGIIKED